MMNFQINSKQKYFVVKDGTPPKPVNFRNRGSKWRDLFESMKPGEWFLISNEFATRTQQAGATYLRGRYSCYKISSSEYCFVKLR